MPKLTFGDSGESDVDCAPIHPVGRPDARMPSAEVLVDTDRNLRRDNVEWFAMVEFQGSFTEERDECQHDPEQQGGPEAASLHS